MKKEKFKEIVLGVCETVFGTIALAACLGGGYMAIWLAFGG